MNVQNTDLVSLFEDALRGVTEQKLQETGIVVQVSDDMCQVYGLMNAVFGELLLFAGGNRGIVFQLDEHIVSVFLLDSTIPVAEQEVVSRTGNEFKVGVGDALLGRVLDAQLRPIDSLGTIAATEQRSIADKVASIIERTPINESLETGITAIDALVPVGKGQRELLIGNRSTGKTAVALDAILHQKGKNVICIYVAIGLRQANVARIVHLLEEHDALSYSIVINADAGQAVLNQYLAPYVGCTAAEYFRDKGKDVLIVYDDLSNHATAFRQMSLLLRRSPGREAYPGDVFYLHSRLLERAGKFLVGGSITALPIVQIQSDDITAYIPTNLISITDGQIFLDTQLFNQGNRPAVNVELSVSRVGGAAQTRAIKQVTKALRLELAQYHELLNFAQFGSELDEVSQATLRRGAIIVELLKQDRFVTYSFVDQAIMLLAFQENVMDAIPLKQVKLFCSQMISYVQSVYQGLYETILREKELSEESKEQLRLIFKEFSMLFVEND